MMERVKTAPPAMEADGTFFSGDLSVKATLARGFGSRGPGGPGGRPGGGGGGEMRGRGRDREEEPDGDAPQRSYRPESTLPPVRLVLELKNNSSNPISIEFIDCVSELGNFAVYPAKITLEPGQALSPDAMTSKLGVTSDEIPLTLALKRNGETERKVLLLEILKTARSTDK